MICVPTIVWARNEKDLFQHSYHLLLLANILDNDFSTFHEKYLLEVASYVHLFKKARGISNQLRNKNYLWIVNDLESKSSNLQLWLDV